jgi:hypothetical protein
VGARQKWLLDKSALQVGDGDRRVEGVTMRVAWVRETASLSTSTRRISSGALISELSRHRTA